MTGAGSSVCPIQEKTRTISTVLGRDHTLRRPPTAGAMELSEPVEDSYLDLAGSSPPDSVTVGIGDRLSA
jgi:hypothetical protein